MPTLKQIRAAKIVEKHGSVASVMREAGYAPNTIKNPKNLTESKAWKDLMDEALPDSKLLEVHNQGLEATKVVSAVNTGRGASSATADFIDVPDMPTRLKAVQMGYKVKGKLDTGTNVNINEAKILVMPHELIDKYAISSNTSDSSE